MTQNFSAHSGRAESRPFPVAERTWPVWLFFARARNSPRAFCLGDRDRSRGNSCLGREKYHFCIQLELCMERSLIIEQRIFSNYSDFYFIFARWNIKKIKHTRNSRRMFLVFLRYYWNIRREMVSLKIYRRNFRRVIETFALSGKSYHRIDFCNSS